MLATLEDLPLEYSWTTRFMPLSGDAIRGEIDKRARAWGQTKTSVATQLSRSGEGIVNAFTETMEQEARAALAGQEIALSEAERDLRDTRIIAPFNGRLADIAATEGGLVSANEQVARLIDPAKLEDFLGAIVNIYGPRMLRYKGVLNMQGTDRKVIFQGVHQLMGSDLGPVWADGEARMSKMVFIGIDLPKDILVQGLDQALV